MAGDPVDHCLSLLELLAESGTGLALDEIAARLAVPRAAAHHMLGTLALRGYARQDPATEAYTASLRLALLGFRFLDTHRLPDAAQGVLDQLARETGEQCRLAVVDDAALIWVARAQGRSTERTSLRYDPPMDQPASPYASAAGLAWLATLPEAEALRIAKAAGFPPPSLRPGRALDLLRLRLAETRRRGFMEMEHEGDEQGTVAFACAIRPNRTLPAVGAISLAGPAHRFTPDRRRELATPLATAARTLTALWPLRQRQRRGGDGQILAG